MPKDIRLKTTHYFIIKISSKREFKQIALKHSFDMKFKDLMKLYKDFTKEPFSFSVKVTTLPSDNSLKFTKNLLKNDT